MNKAVFVKLNMFSFKFYITLFKGGIFLNSVTLIGRLTADPELRFFSTGVAISKITVAIDRSYRKDNQSVTDFIPIEIWGKKAEYCATYIEKGCLVAISGSLHIDRYVDSLGNNKTFAKVVANSITKLNSPNKSGDGSNSDTSASSSTVANNGGSSDVAPVANTQSSSVKSTTSKTAANNSSSVSGENATSTPSTTPPSVTELAGDDDIPF